MERSDLNKILRKNFTKYSVMDYTDFCDKPRKATWYYNKEEEFHIIVFDADDAVFQVGTEANTIGVELKTPAALNRRFQSFTGTKLK